MTRSSLCCLAALLTGLATIQVTCAQAEETPGAPRQNILASTAPAELPQNVDAVAPSAAAASNAAASTAAIVVPVAVGPGHLDGLIARHAAANNVPEALVRRVIKRESRGNARAISRGNYGLMQIRLGTARSLGYRGGAAGLLDADTNMTYAVKYLAGAYRVAGGNPDRAVHYYAAGYYDAAKRQGVPMPGSHTPLNIVMVNTTDLNPTGATAAVTQTSLARR